MKNFRTVSLTTIIVEFKYSTIGETCSTCCRDKKFIENFSLKIWCVGQPVGCIQWSEDGVKWILSLVWIYLREDREQRESIKGTFLVTSWAVVSFAKLYLQGCVREGAQFKVCLLGCVTLLGKTLASKGTAEGPDPLLPVLTALRNQKHKGDDTSATRKPTLTSLRT
jgi:hypothetical protein